jgi:cytoskeletal protein CcmA (bactofilin family)
VFAGEVTGDAFALGREILSQSEITGDTFFVGEEVRIEGTVGDDVRVIGGSVSIDGTVSDDVIAVGSKVVIKPTARIEGSLYLVAEDAQIYGEVLGGANVMSNKLLLSGAIEGDLELWGKAQFKEPARIGGDFIHHTRDRARAPTNAVITGKHIVSEWKNDGAPLESALFGGFFSLKALMMLALGFVLFFLARERVEEVLLDVLPEFWPRALRGFLLLLILPIAALILVFSVIGIPIALILGALLLILFLLSFVLSGILLGAWSERIFFKRSAFPLSYRPVLFGIVFLVVLSVIPFIGPLIHGILLLGTAGSLGTIFFRKLRALI